MVEPQYLFYLKSTALWIISSEFSLNDLMIDSVGENQQSSSWTLFVIVLVVVQTINSGFLYLSWCQVRQSRVAPILFCVNDHHHHSAVRGFKGVKRRSRFNQLAQLTSLSYSGGQPWIQWFKPLSLQVCGSPWTSLGLLYIGEAVLQASYCVTWSWPMCEETEQWTLLWMTSS